MLKELFDKEMWESFWLDFFRYWSTDEICKRLKIQQPELNAFNKGEPELFNSYNSIEKQEDSGNNET